MNYSRFLFLGKVEELGRGLKNIYSLDSDVIDLILKSYVNVMYSYGTCDFRVENTSNPQHFEDRAAVLVNSDWNSTWVDWDVETFQFTTGLLDDVFIVLMYRPGEEVINPVKDLEYLLDSDEEENMDDDQDFEDSED